MSSATGCRRPPINRASRDRLLEIGLSCCAENWRYTYYSWSLQQLRSTRRRGRQGRPSRRSE
eukprot:752894-Prorocentrum_minimum.AAC.2